MEYSALLNIFGLVFFIILFFAITPKDIISLFKRHPAKKNTAEIILVDDEENYPRGGQDYWG